MAYEKSFEVSWAQLDANNHMANTAYLDICVDVRFSYFASQGFVASEFRGHELRNARCSSDARPRIERQRASSAREDVFDSARHFVTDRMNNIGVGIRKVRVQGRGKFGIGVEVSRIGAADRKLTCAAGLRNETGKLLGAIDRILSHFAIGGPLAAGDREQPGI